MTKTKKSADSAPIASQTQPSTSTTPDPEYLIDGILPAHEIHLIVGPDGERGKRNTFMFQMLSEWSQGRNTFNGFDSHPVPFVYVCYGHTLGATRRALASLRIVTKFETVFLSTSDAKDLTNVILRAQEAVPDVRLIVLDSISALCPGSRDNRIAAEMLNRLQELCTKCGITILGVASYPKAKAGEQYPNVRDRVSGGGAFSQFAETIIAIEALEYHHSINYGVTASVGSTEEEETFPFHWDNVMRKLIPGYILPDQEPGWRDQMDEWLDKYKAGDVITTEDVYSASKDLTDVKRASVFSWIEEKRTEGRLMSQMRGKYIVTHRN